jgi:3',5'-cyclic AMP phosphodiesterase CpdA
MSYDLDTLIARWRSEMEDTVEPYLWTNAEIVEYFGEAQDEFCEEVDVLNHELTINYTATDPWVSIPYYVTRIRGAETPEGRDVSLFNYEEFLDCMKTDDYGISSLATDWKSKTGSYPEAMITDIEKGKGRLYPIPTADGTFTLTIYRRAIEPLEDSEELEVVDREHQRCILLKARSLGYLKHDSETYDSTKAADFDALFDDQIMELKSRVARSRRRAKATAYGGL